MNRFFIPVPSRRAARVLCALAFITSIAPAVAQTPSGVGGKRRNPGTTPTSAPASGTAPAASEPEASAMIDAGAAERGAAAPAPPASTETEILASTGATFTSKDRIAVFTGDVRVHDPKFQLACDKLTVFLSKPAEKAAPGTAAGTPPPLAGASPSASPAEKSGGGGGIDHAIAEGNVIIIQERPAQPGSEAKRSVGRAKTATFDNKTGDMTLKGRPSVEQNGNSHVATAEETVMILRRDNSLDTKGPSRTLITQKGKGGNVFEVGPTGGPASSR